MAFKLADLFKDLIVLIMEALLSPYHVHKKILELVVKELLLE